MANKELVSKDEALVPTGEQSPIAIMQLAMNKDLDLDRIEKMLELQTKYEEREAKKAYTLAMTELKLDPPKILKDAKVDFTSSKGRTNYKHASLGNVEAHVTPWLASGGFSVSFKPEQQDDGQLKVTCIVTHKLGHSEEYWIKAGADDTGNKNSIQAINSTNTYLQRYTLLCACGLATHDQDDDGRGSEPQEIAYLDKRQKSTVVDMIADAEADEAEFLDYLGAESIDTIKAISYNKAVVALKLKKERQTK